MSFVTRKVLTFALNTLSGTIAQIGFLLFESTIASWFSMFLCSVASFNVFTRSTVEGKELT